MAHPQVPTPTQAKAAAKAAEARELGKRVGVAYGEFRADADKFLMVLFETPKTGGVPLWDRMSPEERLRSIAGIRREFDALPKLPVAPDLATAAALREGFLEGAKSGFEIERFKLRAVWVACELAQIWAIGRAASPRAVAIGAFDSSKLSDCAAHTAARAIREMNGAEIDAGWLARTFGLPRVAISNLRDAMSYALNWFEGVGIKLAPKPVDFHYASQRGVPQGVIDRYVVFFKGGKDGGHVAYGEITANGTRIIDNQAGLMWTNVVSAQNALQMEITAGFRIESVTVP
jgi:hypothetical protein